MGLLDLFQPQDQASYIGRLQAKATRNNPAYAQQYLAEMEAKRKAALYQQAAEAMKGYNVDYNAPPEQRYNSWSNHKLLSGNSVLMDAALGDQRNMQGSVMSNYGQLQKEKFNPTANTRIAGTPIKLKNGNYGYFDKITNRIVDTGTAYSSPYENVMINNMPHNYDPRLGTITTPPGGPSHDQVVDQKVKETTKIKQAESKVKTQDEYNDAANLAQEASNYVQEAREIVGRMSERQLGPVANMMPNFSEDAQLLQMTLNNLIGNVRGKLGPGILSDTDIKLLKSMIPNMGMDKSTLLKALNSFEKNLQRIIAKKTGIDTYGVDNDPLGIRKWKH